MGRRKPPGIDLHHSRVRHGPRTSGISGRKKRHHASRHGKLEGHTKKGVSAHGRRGRGAHAMHPHSTEGLMTTVREAPASKSADFCNARFSTKVALAAAIAAAVLSAVSPPGVQAKPVSSAVGMGEIGLSEVEHDAYDILRDNKPIPFKGNFSGLRSSLERESDRYLLLGADEKPTYWLPLAGGRQLKVTFDPGNERIKFHPPGGKTFYLYYSDAGPNPLFFGEGRFGPTLAVSEEGGTIDVWLFSRKKEHLPEVKGMHEMCIRIRFRGGVIDPEAASYTHYVPR